MEKVKQKRRYRILFFLVRKQDNDDVPSQSTGKKRIKLAVLWTCMIVFFLMILHPQEQLSIETNKDLPQESQYRDRKSNYHNYSKTEVRHVVFLKVHKAASSTIQNILFRFGVKRNLSFVIPTKEFKFSEQGDSHAVLLDPLKGGHYDIFTLHAVFNHSMFSKLMPANTFYIAIVRNPLEQMISSAFYNRDKGGVTYLRKAPPSTFIQSLIQFPELYDKEEFSLTKNGMAKDFGFPSGLHVQNTESVQHYLHSIGKIFTFVLIVEHFTESLVLLKRYLNWDTASILYIPVNENKHKTADELNITEADRKKFKDRNFLDCAIYDFFYEKFISELSRQNADFFAEVDHFKTTRRRVEIYCLLGNDGSQPLVVSESKWHRRFEVRPSDCDDMRTPELQYIDYIRERQIQQLYNSL